MAGMQPLCPVCQHRHAPGPCPSPDVSPRPSDVPKVVAYPCPECARLREAIDNATIYLRNREPGERLSQAELWQAIGRANGILRRALEVRP